MTIWRQLATILHSKSRPSGQQMCPPGDCGAMSPTARAWFLAFVLLGLGFPVAAHAGWPERPVKLIVTFPPGSANDAAARIFANGLSKKWGKPVVVEDRPGAEGTIGVGAFLASQDDHTLLYTVAGSVTVAPLLIDHLTYDVDRDLVPIAATTAIVLTLAVTDDLPIRSIRDLMDVVRSNPGKYAWASGPSLPRYVFAAFLKRNDLVMNFVSYRDASQPQADLGEGRIQVLVTSADGLLLSSPERKGALPRGDQSDPSRRIARTSDRT
jgi:tripartite-type tricarboxylate transporter receptor subunit TctC